jgi:DNA-binding NarL/FixJ family response regulator
MIRILVVDDHPAVREGLVGIFLSDPDFRVVGEAGSAEEALDRLSRCDPHVISVDARLPGMSGLSLCTFLLRTKPQVRSVVLGSYNDDHVVLDALAAGAHGFVRKGSSPRLLREAVRTVARGETFIDPAVREDLALTPTDLPKGS